MTTVKCFSGARGASFTHSVRLLVVNRLCRQTWEPTGWMLHLAKPPLRGHFFLQERRFRQIAVYFPRTHVPWRPQSCCPHAWQLCTNIKPIFLWAFECHRGETEAKPRKYSEEKTRWKKYFKALIQFEVAAEDSLECLLHTLPLIFILEELRRQKGKVLWYRSISLEVRQKNTWKRLLTMQDVSLSIREIYFYFCALEGSICVNGFHCSKSCDMASARPNDHSRPGLGRAGAGEGSIWQPSFQLQMHGQIYGWDLTLL